MKDPIKVAAGKRSRTQGLAFESRVREDLESKGWIVDKWSNNVEFEKYGNGCQEYYELASGDLNRCKAGEWCDACEEKVTHGRLVKAKAKWAGPGRPMMMGSGFPDFIVMQKWDCCECESKRKKQVNTHEIIGVESKMDGKLDKAEKEKCKWMIENNIFSKILIASKTKVKNKIVVEYTEWK